MDLLRLPRSQQRWIFIVAAFMIACCVVFQVIYSSLALEDIHVSSSRREAAFVRAIVVHIPRDRGDDAVDEFRWLHASWKDMIQHQPSTWRTDLVVVTGDTDDTAFLPDDLKCNHLVDTPSRTNRIDSSECVVLLSVSSSDSAVPFELDMDAVRSLHAIASADLSMYDWTLATSPNAIIAPAFAGWKPTKFVAGSGLSAVPFSQELLNNMTAVSADFGLTSAHPTDHTFGLSWYGATEDIQACSKIVVDLMRHVAARKDSGSNVLQPSSLLPEIAATMALPECTQFTGGMDFAPAMLDVPAFRLDAASSHAVLVPPAELATAVHEPTSFKKDSTIGFALDIARSVATRSLFQNELTTGLDRSFVRAIVVYFPFASYRTGQAELRWLHRSWRQMLRHQPPHWRTDLVVFSDHSSPLFAQLLCNSPGRQSAADPDRCIVIDSHRQPAHHAPSVGILDVLATQHSVLSPYDWILRSDLDSFVTPGFATWRPAAFSVSRPSDPYCAPNTRTCGRLRRIAKNMALDVTRQAFGSTWYGPLAVVQACAKLAIEVVDHMYDRELSDEEKHPSNSHRGHPEWNVDLLHLYAGHIALQHCTALDRRSDVLDVAASSSRRIDSMVHLKASTNSNRFSRFGFHAGKALDGVSDVAHLDRDVAKDFATIVALEANQGATDASFLNGLDDPFVRAAVLYLPTGGTLKYESEMRWFHASWRDMVTHQPAKWRTDIVVFTDGDLKLWKDLQCTTELRKTPEEPNKCIVVHGYKKVKSKTFDYGFADSINVVAIENEATAPYDWILRTDIDTFFTPAFATWKPLKFTVGSVGGYCFNGYDTCDRLAGIAKKLKLTVSPVDDIGSTWYGPREMVQECGKLSMQVINHLHLHEFNETEKSNEYANELVAGWPRWHYGVLTMYSGHLAIPHCTLATGFDKWDAMLDFGTYSNDTVGSHAHLHARQSYEPFSKFYFQRGDYDDIEIESVDRSTVSGHAMYMALTSKDRPHEDHNDSFVRAAVMYVPQTGEAGFRWFHLSWKAMVFKEPRLWRTDLVVFATEAWPFFRELNCTTTPRRSRAEPNRCIVMPSYKTVTTEDFAFERADETNILTAKADDLGILDAYDWLLKTDVETFLTPAFATWKPDTFTFGSSGEYSFPGQPTSKRLKSISASLNLHPPTVEDVGASWYGPASVVRSCAALSVRLMHHLHQHEFTAVEKSREYYRVKVAGWPHWHYGILHMYAGHLAIPHCTKDTGGFNKVNGLMDYSTDLNGKISKHPHLRAAQGAQKFSLRAFNDGQYAGVDVKSLRTSLVSDYALLLALQSKKLADNAPLPFTNGLNNVFVRAAVVYLPSTGDSKFQAEMRWFHASWLDMVTHQPAKWRTDIVVFTDGDLKLWKDLQCTTELRTSPEEPNKCIIVHGYKKVKSKTFDYGFADSINVVAIENEATAPYDWILRTDIDTFFTPAFATWKPLKFTVGSVGGYCFNGYDTCDRLAGIAKKLKLTVSPVDDIGSTWYGPREMVQECGKLSMQVINHLHLHEFNETEKSNEYANELVAGWPRWHYGVLTMYSGHLAIPHCTLATGFDKRDDLLDYPTFSNESVKRHPHVHARQSYEPFSKYYFRLGKYDDIDPDTLDKSIVSEYTMYMALTSRHDAQLVQPEHEESFVRAAVLYVPQTGEAGFRWFHLSWMTMTAKEPRLWRTDLVVFATEAWPFFRELNCTTTPRRSRSEPNRCIVMSSYKTIATDDFVFPKADETNILAATSDATGILDAYDWLLKTDVETFLTPAFATWKPDTFTFGSSGEYSFPGQPTSKRLKSISASLNLRPPTVEDVGASWYGPASVVRSCAALSVRLMHHLHQHEFTAGEKDPMFVYSAKGWPHWHYGILHMYAGHLAIPHCTKDTGGFTTLNSMMDFSTVSKDRVAKHAHLRAAQGPDAFSSRAFNDGQYDAVDVKALRPSIVSDYAVLMAVQAKRMAEATPLGFDNGLNESFVRAAVVYLPSDNSKFVEEMLWFHETWLDMVPHQPAKWRTDIVVFTDGDLPLWEYLNCTTALRTTPDEPDRCIIVHGYKKVKSKSFDYGFADSINVVAIENAATAPYDWILRTDIDTFFTPAFATWKPLKFTVGSVGGYCYDGYDTCDHLADIATKLQLKVSPVDDIGSTWYGPREMIQECGKLSMQVINHLHLHEFNETEKSNDYAKVRIAGWPRWHYGVLTMYSGHLAIPNCTLPTGFDKRDELLDFPTFSNASVLRHPHVHARQDLLFFSKAHYRQGDYDKMKLEELDVTKVSEYATYMVLKSNRRYKKAMDAAPKWN